MHYFLLHLNFILFVPGRQHDRLFSADKITKAFIANANWASLLTAGYSKDYSLIDTEENAHPSLFGYLNYF